MATQFVFSKAVSPLGAGPEAVALAKVYRDTVNQLSAIIKNSANPELAVPLAIEQVRPTLTRAFSAFRDAIVKGGVKQEGPLSKLLSIAVKFDLDDPRAIAFAESLTGELIVQIEDSIKAQIKDLVTRSLAEGILPTQVAYEISQTIGLHTRWANAVVKFESSAFDRLLGSMGAGKAKIEAANQAAAYRQRLIRSRANAIARTEISRAQNYGRYLSWLQAADGDLIDPATTGKRWMATAPCPICKKLHGKTVGLLEWWDDKYNMPPIHPHCKCTAVLVPNWAPAVAPKVKPADAIVKSADPREELVKAYQRKFGTKREAAQFAANKRWGNRGPDPAGPTRPPKAEWTDLPTLVAIEKEWMSRYPHMTINLVGDKNSMPVDTANEFAAAFMELADEYPEAALDLTNVYGGTGHPRTLGYVNKKLVFADGTSRGASMALTVDYTADELNIVHEKEIGKGWSPKGTSDLKRTLNGRPITGARYTITHEFGHIVDGSLLSKTDPESSLPAHNKAIDRARAQIKKQYVAENGPTVHPTSRIKTDTATAVGRSISFYANESRMELFAEAFSEYHLSDNPRFASRIVMETVFAHAGQTYAAPRLEKAYQRKFGTKREAAQFAANKRWGNRGPDPTGPERGKWKEQDTRDAINAQWKEQWGTDVPGSFSGLSIGVANTVAATANELLAQYPQVVASGLTISSSSAFMTVNPVGSSRDDLRMSSALGDAFPGKAFPEGVVPPFIRVNTRWGSSGESVTDKGDDAWSTAAENSVREGFSVKGTLVGEGHKASRQTVTHEFGHHVGFTIDRYLQSKGVPLTERVDKYYEAAIRAAAPKRKSTTGRQPVPITRDNIKFVIAEKLSDYATSNHKEMFAEAFLEVSLSAKPRPFAKALVKELVALVPGLPYPKQLGLSLVVQKSGWLDAISKAYQRKFGTKREAAQFAANRRWGNRTGKTVPARGQWQNLDTVNAINKQWNEQWGDPDGTSGIQGNFSGFSAVQANSAAATLNELLVLYPEVQPHLNIVGTDIGFPETPYGAIASKMFPPLGSRSMGDSAMVDKDGYIRLNATLKEREFAVMQMGSIDRGFLAGPKPNWEATLDQQSAQAVRGVVVHEFGHVVDFYQIRKAPMMSDMSKERGRIAITSSGNADAQREYINETISGYAATSKYEEFAEMFTTSYLGGRNASEATLYMREAMEPMGGMRFATLEKAYQRKFGTKREAAQFAANRRWGNRGSETKIQRFVPSDALYAAIDESVAKDDIFALFSQTPEGKKWIDQLTDEVWNGDSAGAFSAANHMYRAHRNFFLMRSEASPKIVTNREKRLLKIVGSEPISINMTDESFGEIVQDGRFKSQFETQDSGGTYNPGMRKKAEAIKFGVPVDIPPSQRPIYGSIDAGGTTSDDSMAWMYGKVRVVLKNDVRSRSTFTTADSLLGEIIPSAVTNPHTRGTQVTGTAGDGNDPYHGFIEAQIHGGVRTSDIAEIVIRGREGDSPTGAWVSKMASVQFAGAAGIPVRFVEWNGNIVDIGGPL